MNFTYANKHPELTYVPLLIHLVPLKEEKTDFTSVCALTEQSLSDILSFANESSKPITIAKNQYLLLLTEESSVGSGIVLRQLKLLNLFYESHYQIHLDLFWGYDCPCEQLPIQCNYLVKQAEKKHQGKPLCHNLFLVHETIEYLLEDPAQSCDELADKLALHPDYLMKIFKQETDQSLSDFITMLRIKDARKLLQYTSLSIAEIAARIAYYNVSYFNRIFKEKTGLSPREYRKKYQKSTKNRSKLIFTDILQQQQNQA